MCDVLFPTAPRTKDANNVDVQPGCPEQIRERDAHVAHCVMHTILAVACVTV